MRIKKIAKRLFAVGAGATMLGATVMGAMAAADLNQYPGMFVSDSGSFNGFFVVGENAKSVDNLAAIDIAGAMKSSKAGSTESSTVYSVEGDAWRVTSGTDVLEFNETIGASSQGVVDFIDGDSLGALASGSFKNSKGDFDYDQFLHFDNSSGRVRYTKDDNDNTDLFFYIADNSLIARYEMDFNEAAESDIDASESYELEDFEGKDITMLGKTYNIVQAKTGGYTGGTNSYQVTLTLMAGAVRDTLEEGESQTYTIKSEDGTSKDYAVELQFVDSGASSTGNRRAKFVIDGETSNLMEEGETFTLTDGTVLGVSEVLYQDYAGGIHNAEFFLGADKIELQDDNINASSGSSDELKVNEETVDGASVIITGTMLDKSTSLTDDGELELDSIEINMTAEDDYFVPAGEKLGEQSELVEKDLLFTKNWDFFFNGFEDITTHPITVKPTSNEEGYEITFYNARAQKISLPFVYSGSGTTLKLGDKDDLLQLNKSMIADENYFILNDDTDEDSITHVVQYKGAKVSSDSTKLKFKILATGETVERTFDTSTNSSTLKLDGSTYTFIGQGNTSGGEKQFSTDDFNISLSSGAASTYSASHVEGRLIQTDYLIANGGAKIFIMDPSAISNVTTKEVKFNVSLIDADAVNDVVTATTTNPYVVVGYNISASSAEVDFSSGNAGSVELSTLDSDSDVSQGYSLNGAWVKITAGSGSNDADKLEIEWPETERLPMLYVTSGAVETSSSKTGGALGNVEVIDATRLDSEVSDAKAQNLIVVGGPCVNSVAAELMGNPTNCAEGFTPGKALIKLWEHDNGKYAMLVAGYSGADTRLAGRVIAHRFQDKSFKGTELEVSGTTHSDAKLGAPVAKTETTTE